MRDATGKIIGIRLRCPISGCKWAVSGSRQGLFVPIDLIDQSLSGRRLLICEGPTDTAALLDLGFIAIGRPSCMGGVDIIRDLVTVNTPAEVVIITDADAPGQRGADQLAAVLAAYIGDIRIITPPEGIKDARVWRQAGAIASDIVAAISMAPQVSLKVVVREIGVPTHVCT